MARLLRKLRKSEDVVGLRYPYVEAKRHRKDIGYKSFRSKDAGNTRALIEQTTRSRSPTDLISGATARAQRAQVGFWLGPVSDLYADSFGNRGSQFVGVAR